MQTYRIRIQPLGGFITPFKADTLFGGLCWSIRYQYGEDTLVSFLDLYRAGHPPLIWSDAFPGDLLPRPRIRVSATRDASRVGLLANLKEAKKMKNMAYVDPKEFDALRRGEHEQLTLRTKKPPFKQMSQFSNQINRLEMRSRDGGLFFQEECYLDPSYGFLTVYAGIKKSLFEVIQGGLRALGRTGVGKRKSAGKGAFRVLEFSSFEFDSLERANAFIALSDFIPAASDPTKGNYGVRLKYGKLAEEYALRKSPFKRPLLMLEAGSCFCTDQPGKPYFGRIIEDIAPGFPEALHYGFAFPVPAFVPHEPG